MNLIIQYHSFLPFLFEIERQKKEIYSTIKPIHINNNNNNNNKNKESRFVSHLILAHESCAETYFSIPYISIQYKKPNLLKLRQVQNSTIDDDQTDNTFIYLDWT